MLGGTGPSEHLLSLLFFGWLGSTQAADWLNGQEVDKWRPEGTADSRWV